MYYKFKIQLEYLDGLRDEFAVSTYQISVVKSLPEILLRGSNAFRCILLDSNGVYLSHLVKKNQKKIRRRRQGSIENEG